MEHLQRLRGGLCLEAVALERIAEEVGTPVYVYSRAAIESRWQAWDRAFGDHPHLVCYAVKANGNLGVLGLLAGLGSGFDIVSGGELERVLRAGGDPARIAFSGVGKTHAELRRALEVGVHCLNVESAAELARLDTIARGMGVRAPVAVRINPDVDPRTHPHIATGLRHAKFGVPVGDALELYHYARGLEGIALRGVACHIGSQLMQLDPLVEAARRVAGLASELVAEGVELDHVDLGGGFGIGYRGEQPPAPQAWVDALLEILLDAGLELCVAVEPGRSIVGEAGVLLTRVEYVKPGIPNEFAVVDAAMNDLIRPALYDAWMDIVPVRNPPPDRVLHAVDVVGPVCESADVLGRDRRLAPVEGDLLAVCSAGAYGAVMSSNYNARPRAAEVVVDGDAFTVTRRRESIDDMMAGERLADSQPVSGGE